MTKIITQRLHSSLSRYFEPMLRKAVENEALALWREWLTLDGDPFYAGEISGDPHCFFCGLVFFGESDKHAPSCIFVRAKKLVEKADSP
jgi:hypothetical protein